MLIWNVAKELKSDASEGWFSVNVCKECAIIIAIIGLKPIIDFLHHTGTFNARVFRVEINQKENINMWWVFEKVNGDPLATTSVWLYKQLTKVATE